MKKLALLLVFATPLLLAGLAAPAQAADTAATPAISSGDTVRVATYVYGPYYSYDEARSAAYHLQRRGWYTQIYYRHGAWYVRAWR